MTTGTDTTTTTTTPPATPTTPPTLEQQVDAAVAAAQADTAPGTDLVKSLTDFKTALELEGGNFLQLFEWLAKQAQGISVLTKPTKLPDKL